MFVIPSLRGGGAERVISTLNHLQPESYIVQRNPNVYFRLKCVSKQESCDLLTMAVDMLQFV